MNKQNRFFTLIESLIVIAILMSFSTLLFPALKKAIVTSENIACFGQYRQVATILSMYLDDYNDTLPHEDFGSGGSYPTNSCWVNALDVETWDTVAYNKEDGYTWKMNSRLEDYKGSKSFRSGPFRKMHTVPDPSLSPFLFEAQNSSYQKNRPYGMHKTTQAHHDDEVNILFLDFSVRSIWDIPRPDGGWETTAGLWWDPDAPLDEQLD